MKKIAWLFVLLVVPLVFAACTDVLDSNKEDANACCSNTNTLSYAQAHII